MNTLTPDAKYAIGQLVSGCAPESLLKGILDEYAHRLSTGKITETEMIALYQLTGAVARIRQELPGSPENKAFGTQPPPGMPGVASLTCTTRFASFCPGSFTYEYFSTLDEAISHGPSRRVWELTDSGVWRMARSGSGYKDGQETIGERSARFISQLTQRRGEPLEATTMANLIDSICTDAQAMESAMDASARQRRQKQIEKAVQEAEPVRYEVTVQDLGTIHQGGVRTLTTHPIKPDEQYIVDYLFGTDSNPKAHKAEIVHRCTFQRNDTDTDGTIVIMVKDNAHKGKMFLITARPY